MVAATSCALLAYTALFVPMQLSFWQTEDPCDVPPTLYFDMLVDCYFMVALSLYTSRVKALL